MKIILPGGTGQVGNILARAFASNSKNEVVVLTRNLPSHCQSPWRFVHWDAKSVGPWQSELENSDVVINLAGKSVNCRYTLENRKIIKQSRVDSVNAIGNAIKQCRCPPRVWLQSSTATIYQHTLTGPANGESNGIIGGEAAGAPDTWRFSIDVAKAWEATLDQFDFPDTRTVAMRAAMIMSPDRDGVFDVLMGLVRKRLGGSINGGKQFVSWIHDQDFVRAVKHVIATESLSGHINFAAPSPLIQSEFMHFIREAAGIKLGLPATKWMVEIGAIFMKTESELILKSRKVIPERLEQSGFQFDFENWESAVKDLMSRWQS